MMNCSLGRDIQEKNPYGNVHVEVVQVIRWISPVNFAVRSNRLSPRELQLLETYENYVAICCLQL